MYVPGGPLVAGPVWDFDYGTYRKDRVSGWYSDIALWYPELLKKPEFVSCLKDHWNRYRNDFYLVADNIYKVADQIRNSCERDLSFWPVTADTNLDNQLCYIEAVLLMESVLRGRLKWLDSSINAL